MALANPSRALEPFLLLDSPKLLTLTGTQPFITNLFRLVSHFALLVVLHLVFLIGALVWFIKITNVIAFECDEVFRKNQFLALYFSLILSMIFLVPCVFPSAALFMLTIWPFGPPPSRSMLREGHIRRSVSIRALI